MKQTEKIKYNEEQVKKMMENQTHVLEAIKNLNDRIEVVEHVLHSDQMKDAKEMIENQELIDEIIVRNSDNIKSIQKWKEINSEVILNLDIEIKTMKKKEKEIMEIIRDVEKKKDKTMMNSNMMTIREDVGIGIEGTVDINKNVNMITLQIFAKSS